MELLKLGAVRIIDSSIQNESWLNVGEVIDVEFEELRRFIIAVLLGQDSSGFCRIRLQEFVRECVSYEKTEFLIREIDNLLNKLLTQSLSEIEDNFGQIEDNFGQIEGNLRAKRALSCESQEYFNLLTKFETFWCRIRTGIVEVIKVCDPLAGKLNKPQSCHKYIEKVVEYFKKDCEERGTLYDNLQSALLNLVSSYRTGKNVNFTQLQNVINLFISIGLFEEFEEKLLLSTTRFYSSLSRDYMNSFSNVDCFYKFNNTIDLERRSCECYLIPETTVKVINTVKNELLYIKSDVLISHERLKNIIKLDDLDTILLINSLYSNSEYTSLFLDNLFKAFKEIFSEYLSDYVKSRDYEKSDLLVSEMSDYQDKIEKYARPITTQSDYNSRIKKFWISVFATNDSVIEYVTLTFGKYCDELHINSSEVQDKMKFFLFIFQFLPNKSYFEMCIRTFLTVRLLYHKYLDTTHINIIKSLEKECGPDYTCKLSDLVDFYEKSKKLVIDSGIARYNFGVVLLNKECWIQKNIREFDVPERSREFSDSEVVEMEKSTSFQPPLDNPTFDPEEGTTLDQILQLQSDFKSYYDGKFNKKTLQYLHHLGSAELQIIHNGREYEFRVSSYQGYCLLLFNTQKYVTLAQLEKKLSPDYDDATMRTQLSVLEDHKLIKFHNPELSFISCGGNDYFELELSLCEELLDLMPEKEELFNMNMDYIITKSSFDDMMLYIESTIMLYLKQMLEASSTTIFKLFSKNPNFTLSRQQFNRIVDSLVARGYLKYKEATKEIIQFIP